VSARGSGGYVLDRHARTKANQEAILTLVGLITLGVGGIPREYASARIEGWWQRRKKRLGIVWCDGWSPESGDIKGIGCFLGTASPVPAVPVSATAAGSPSDKSPLSERT